MASGRTDLRANLRNGAVNAAKGQQIVLKRLSAWVTALSVSVTLEALSLPRNRLTDSGAPPEGDQLALQAVCETGKLPSRVRLLGSVSRIMSTRHSAEFVAPA
jgi:hypothetical protein